ncbi:hypothetical protein J5Y04_23035 [Kitasatospora sp. RG8]|uniref:hypothetical protein n=1 Tax=Kitasatospora sp. RG8 TaxID=2820815 RepID=UPI001AE01EF2|nr:hypothetical protein [Kitasatospora sp. RG8]MBP0452396.1 hypothetical protein [Kitasatospora sp. RG8]
MTTPPPPPPNYAPTTGLPTTWWSQTSAAVWTPERITTAEAAQARLAASMDELSRRITETPEERRRRERAENDAIRAAAGEKPGQRAARHRIEDRRAQRAASRLWKADPGERARRFRRWCVLTALSASAGYSVGLVQWVSTLPPLVTGLFALPAAYWLDLRMRGGVRDAVRLSGLRGARPISAVVLARVPVSSVLASLLHLDGLPADTGHLFHHH